MNHFCRIDGFVSSLVRELLRWAEALIGIILDVLGARFILKLR
jgi:hypothetical protein